jgi:hypothetical protein
MPLMMGAFIGVFVIRVFVIRVFVYSCIRVFVYSCIRVFVYSCIRDSCIRVFVIRSVIVDLFFVRISEINLDGVQNFVSEGSFSLE